MRYNYQVAGHWHEGAFQTTLKKRQPEVMISVSASHPELSTNQLPEERLAYFRQFLGGVTGGFLLMGGLLLMNGWRGANWYPPSEAGRSLRKVIFSLKKSSATPLHSATGRAQGASADVPVESQRPLGSRRSRVGTPEERRGVARVVKTVELAPEGTFRRAS